MSVNNNQKASTNCFFFGECDDAANLSITFWAGGGRHCVRTIGDVVINYTFYCLASFVIVVALSKVVERTRGDKKGYNKNDLNKSTAPFLFKIKKSFDPTTTINNCSCCLYVSVLWW
jgi:hypothetical protein